MEPAPRGFNRFLATPCSVVMLGPARPHSWTEYVIRAFDDDDGRVIPRPVSEQSHRAGINHSQTISFLSSPL